MNRPICPRCEINSQDKEEIERIIAQRIELLGENRADDELYKSRLSVCSRCDKLIEGTCVLCGCYVKLRAAKINQHCPLSRDVW